MRYCIVILMSFIVSIGCSEDDEFCFECSELITTNPITGSTTVETIETELCGKTDEQIEAHENSNTRTETISSDGIVTASVKHEMHCFKIPN